MRTDVRQGAEVSADLVVDATGQGSRSPRWLADHGREVPVIEQVPVDLVYASRVYRRHPEQLGGDALVSIRATPQVRRSGSAVAMEGNRWLITPGGYRGERPPLDAPGFESFAGTILSGEIAAIIESSEPLSDPVRFSYPKSRRVRYERLRDFPEGYLVFADAICTLTPSYGQGMTVAALQALALRDCLGRPDLSRRFFARAASVVDVPWGVALRGDLRLTGVSTPQARRVKIANAYLARLKHAAATDGQLALALLRVANLIDQPATLHAPPMARRVLKANLSMPQRRPNLGSADRSAPWRPSPRLPAQLEPGRAEAIPPPSSASRQAPTAS